MYIANVQHLFISPLLALANGILTVLYKGPCKVCGIRASVWEHLCSYKCIQNDTYGSTLKNIRKSEKIDEPMHKNLVFTITYCHPMHMWSPRISQTLPFCAQAPRVCKNT